MKHSHKTPFPKKKKNSSHRKVPLSGPKLSLSSPQFIEKVERLDKLMQLANAPTPKGGVLLAKGEEGTLQQVGREADNAWAGVKRIMELLNVEEKYVDYYSAANFNYTGTQLDLMGSITQGVGTSQRTGSSIKITRIQLSYLVFSNGGSTNWASELILSKDGNPALADIFALSGATSSYAGFGLRNVFEMKANPTSHSGKGFVVSAGSGVGNKSAQNVIVDHKLEHHVTFNGATTTVTSGAVTFNIISNLNASVPTFAYHFRIWFVDN